MDLLAHRRKPAKVLLIEEQPDTGIEFFEEEFEVEEFEIKEIFRPVTQYLEGKEYSDLRADLIQQGMRLPIILLENNAKNYVESIINVAEELVIEPDFSRKWLCYVGNQRVSIAESLGFDRISGIRVPTANWAHAAFLRAFDGSF